MAIKPTTALYPRLKHSIENECQRLRTKQIIPWHTFNVADVGVKVKRFDGSLISICNDEFSGSSEDIFWNGYIEPFMEDVILKTLDWTSEQCERKKSQLNTHLEEAAELLNKTLVENLYRKMREIDRRLRGKGFPQRVPLRPVDDEIARMSEFISDHVNSKKKKVVGHPSPMTRRSRYKSLHHKFDVISNKINQKKKRAPSYDEIIQHTDWSLAIEDSGIGSELPSVKTMRNWLSLFNKSIN
jgi:hypothetical protein